jgi:Holliday junction resolvase RusA-like endonuclease
MSEVRLMVYGMPAPQGSKSYKGMSKSGRAILAESSKLVAPWRQDVVHAAKDLMAKNAGLLHPVRFPMDGPSVGRMIFTRPKPKSAPKRKASWVTTTPDLSKLVRSTEDALVTAGLIADDARIIGYSRIWKTYPNEDPEALDSPGAIIYISTLDHIAIDVSGQTSRLL